MRRTSFIFWGIVIVLAGTIFINYLMNKPKLVNGDTARDISGMTVEGDTVSLSELRGDYILLEFWGSWCGPCRRQNPKLRAIGERYMDKTFADSAGFTLVFYALEDNTSGWKNAIDKDQLGDFVHMVDINRMSAAAADAYGVKSIPTSFLIDPQFKIIGVNPDEKTITDILEGKIQR